MNWKNRASRYAPGKRQNSFYVSLPEPKGFEERMEILDRLPGYTYYINYESRTLIREKMNGN